MNPVHVGLTMLAAMALGAIAAFVGGVLRRQGASANAAAPAAFIGLALAAGCAILFLQQEGWPRRVPERGVLGLAPMWASVVITTTVLGLLAAIGTLSSRLGRMPERTFVITVVSALSVALTLALPSVSGDGGDTAPFLPAHMAALGLLGIAAVSAPIFDRVRHFSLAVAVALLFIGPAALLFLSGFAKGAIVSAGAGVALGGAALVTIWRPCALGAPVGVAAAAALTVFSALGFAYMSESDPPFSPVLWLVPPLGIALLRLADLPLVAGRATVQASARIGLALGLVAALVALAMT